IAAAIFLATSSGTRAANSILTTSARRTDFLPDLVAISILSSFRVRLMTLPSMKRATTARGSIFPAAEPPACFFSSPWAGQAQTASRARPVQTTTRGVTTAIRIGEPFPAKKEGAKGGLYDAPILLARQRGIL